MGYYGYPNYWGGDGVWGGGLYPYTMVAGYAGYGLGRVVRAERDGEEEAYIATGCAPRSMRRRCQPMPPPGSMGGGGGAAKPFGCRLL